MNDAPERIWAAVPADGIMKDEILYGWTTDEQIQSWLDEYAADMETGGEELLLHLSYILATPEALAASPEGQALIAAAVADALAPIRAAVTRYHLALDRREHGGVAGSRLQDEVQDILDMHWRQGVAAASIGGDNE